MNILDNSAVRPCTSCQMCGAVCPKNAIRILLDDEGFYRPKVDYNLCVDCSLCVKVCSKFDEKIKLMPESELNRTVLVAAAAKDDSVVRHTTSGGIGDLLAKQLIKEGYKVIGVVYDSEKNCAIHRSADSILATDSFRGSKYIQSYCMDAFRELVVDCRKNSYAVFGLPCQIYAIDRYLERVNKRNNCVLIDLYCHGCPSMHIWSKLTQNIREKLQCSRFKHVNWRSKIRGWGSFVLEVEGENGRRYVSKPMKNEFFDLFFSNQILNESCIDCKLRGTLEYTDIRLGDFWGTEYNKTFRGMSGVSLVTEKAIALFDKIQDQLTLEEKKYNTFLPFQSWSHTYTIDDKLRKQLMQRLKSKYSSIRQCAEPIVKHRNFNIKLTLLFKQLLTYLPNYIEFKVRKFIK